MLRAHLSKSHFFWNVDHSHFGRSEQLNKTHSSREIIFMTSSLHHSIVCDTIRFRVHASSAVQLQRAGRAPGRGDCAAVPRPLPERVRAPREAQGAHHRGPRRAHPQVFRQLLQPRASLPLAVFRVWWKGEAQYDCWLARFPVCLLMFCSFLCLFVCICLLMFVFLLVCFGHLFVSVGLCTYFLVLCLFLLVCAHIFWSFVCFCWFVHIFFGHLFVSVGLCTYFLVLCFVVCLFVCLFFVYVFVCLFVRGGRSGPVPCPVNRWPWFTRCSCWCSVRARSSPTRASSRWMTGAHPPNIPTTWSHLTSFSRKIPQNHFYLSLSLRFRRTSPLACILYCTSHIIHFSLLLCFALFSLYSTLLYSSILYFRLVYQQIVIAALLHPKYFVSFPRIPFQETIWNYEQEAFMREKKNSCRTCRYGVKCRKALWLQASEVLWSNG